MATKFYYCKTCGNVMAAIIKSRVTPSCCGRAMEELYPNASEGLGEKHKPVFSRIDENAIMVRVGSSEHPMSDEHHISFIALESRHGIRIHYLSPGDKPEVTFYCKSNPIAIYAYCNLHGLWQL